MQNPIQQRENYFAENWGHKSVLSVGFCGNRRKVGSGLRNMEKQNRQGIYALKAGDSITVEFQEQNLNTGEKAAATALW